MKNCKAVNLVSCNSRHLCLLLTAFLFAASCFSQITLNIVIDKFPQNSASDSFFVAGNFNNWNPGNLEFKTLKSDKGLLIQLKGLTANNYEFKITKGNWNTVECDNNGNEIGNRKINLSADTTIFCSVKNWKDNFKQTPKKHTASVNVQILDTAFLMPELNSTRRIWLYLPKDYASSKKRYPVIYMQDGQNIFDEYTSAYGEWRVDECLDSLITTGAQASIVVGIDNGPNRLTEYNPFDNDKFGKGQGDAYIDFLVNTLKPFIDRTYRTMASKEHTIIAGSSMGGFISYYAALKYPNQFGKAGIFSPSFWIASEIEKFTDSLGPDLNGKYFFYVGENEGREMVDDMVAIQEKIGENSSAVIYSLIDPTGFHNELTWAKWFSEFYKWILAKGFNVITNAED